MRTVAGQLVQGVLVDGLHRGTLRFRHRHQLPVLPLPLGILLPS